MTVIGGVMMVCRKFVASLRGGMPEACGRGAQEERRGRGSARGLLAALTLVLLLPASASATTYTFSASADARVKSASASSNFGSQNYLATNGSTSDKQETFFRFNVIGLDGPVAGAVLRLRSDTDSKLGTTADGPAVYPTSGAWTESGLT